MPSSIIAFFLLPVLLFPSPCLSEHTHNYYYSYKWPDFERLLDACSRGRSCISGVSKIKRYLHHFGYMKMEKTNYFTDFLDEKLGQALSRYQARLGLPVTGRLDKETISEITAPRCGVQDTVPTPMAKKWLHAKRNYAFFTGQPRWGRSIPMTLTYAFSAENTITSLSRREIRGAFKRAFGHWASVIPVTFLETNDYRFADIKIGFYRGEHGDSEAFDGILGVLAHAFSPESGKFHLDAAETWSVDFESEKSEDAVDLESVATHEIGHLLGLAHSSIKESIMYPSLKPRTKKVDLKLDDVTGIQFLYGSNPNFTIAALSESDTSSNVGVVVTMNSCSVLLLTLAVLLSFICTLDIHNIPNIYCSFF